MGIQEEQQRQLVRDLLKIVVIRKWSTEKLFDEFFNGWKNVYNVRKVLEERGYEFETLYNLSDVNARERVAVRGYRKK